MKFLAAPISGFKYHSGPLRIQLIPRPIGTKSIQIGIRLGPTQIGPNEDDDDDDDDDVDDDDSELARSRYRRNPIPTESRQKAIHKFRVGKDSVPKKKTIPKFSNEKPQL